MDSLWRPLVLDTEIYANLQRTLGFTLHYLPAEDPQRQRQSVQILHRTTLESVYSLFGTEPIMICSIQRLSIPGSYGIFVRSLTGETDHHQVFPSLQVAELKEMIFRRHGLPMEDQRLLFGLEQLKDYNTLSYYKIKENSRLNLVLRLRGC